MLDCTGTDLPVRDQQIVFNQFVVQPRLDQMIEVLPIAAVDSPKECAVFGKEKAAGVSERT